jgi:hypothetical protein
LPPKSGSTSYQHQTRSALAGFSVVFWIKPETWESSEVSEVLEVEYIWSLIVCQDYGFVSDDMWCAWSLCGLGL